MINELISAGWGYHDSDSERLARELETADLAELKSKAARRCLQLSNHTIGEHLGDWPRARRFAETLCAVRPGHLHQAMVAGHLAVARYMDGALAAAQQAEIEALLAGEDPMPTYLQIKALLAGALAGSGRYADAGLVIGAANRLGLGTGESGSDRSMAITNNNLASELVGSENLDAEQTRLMLTSAEAARTFWKRCGTWVNEERAEYLLALVHNRKEDHRRGLEHAETALAVIADNGEEPVDEAFIRLAAAVAHRGLSEHESAAEQISRADAMAATWSDESLVAEYQGDRAKAIGGQG